MALYDCLKTAVGLSEVDCECSTESRPEDYNASLSGYYLDDLEHGVPLVYPSNAAGCGDNNVWELLERGRKAGVNDFAERMAVALGQHKATAFREFSAWMADEKTSSLIPTGNLNTVIGIRLRTKPIKGGKLRIRKISLNLSVAGNYVLKVYNANDLTTTLAEYTIPVTTINKHNVYDLPTELVLDTEDKGDYREYLFLYERGAAQPRNVQFTCGCGSNYRGWMEYIANYNGLSVAAFGDANTPLHTTTNTMGIRLFMNAECDGTEFLCGDHLEFDKSDYGRVIAKTIQLASINKLIHGILSSSRINIYTRANSDMLVEKMGRNEALIINRVEWLAYNLPDSLTDCYKCKRGQIMGTIRV